MEQHNCLRCAYRHEDNGNCTAVGGFCTAVPAAHCRLLQEYLGTGLTPENCAEYRKIEDEIIASGKTFGRLIELLKADREGRVVVLPCKVGDTVWIVGSVRGVYSATVRTFFCGNPSAVRGADDDGYIQMIRTTECDIPIRNFGKTVFLTREEAEAALRRAER